MKVPFVDLQTQFNVLRDEIVCAVEDVMRRGAFILGDEVSAFEREFASFCGVRECIGVGSGCDALLLAIKGSGLGGGDEIIVPTNTFIATVLAVTASGATPVLVDCLEDTYLIDSEAVCRAITPRTKAIIPVHLYGQAADMDAILAVAEEHELVVIEDAAQAHGATYMGRRCGSMGRAGCFSFYPAKNLGAYGDAGTVVTGDPELADYARMFRNYGQKEKYNHVVAGWNTRMDTIQATILRVKQKHLSSWNMKRREHARRYCELLQDTPLILPLERQGNQHVYHIFAVRTPKRDELLPFLKERGVDAGIHYPVPVHLQKAYADLGYQRGDFPCAERIADELLSLPMFPELTSEQIEYVCVTIREFFALG